MRSKLPLDIPTALVLAAMYALLAGNAWLWFHAPLPWPLHVLIGALAIHLAFTVWHEAAHHSASRIGWLNDAVGVVGALPYMAPFYLEKWFHLQHHALMNRPDDPNFIYADGPLWQLPLRYVRVLRFARQRMRDDPRSARERWIDRAPFALVATLAVLAWWQGALPAFFVLWALPFGLAKLVMDWYVNWLPHVGLPADRYRGTRVIDVDWLTPLLLGHNYHAIHHLWPNLPWHHYRRTFREKQAQLRERGVPVETRLRGWSFHDAARRDSVSG